MLKSFLAGFTLAAMAAFQFAQAAGTDYVPQSVSDREVKVTVAPQEIGSDAQTWDFEVVMETHVRSLGDDPTGVSVLVAEGKRYRPVAWEGAPPGGHHRKGLLRFEAVSPRPHMLELQIRLRDDPAPRIFKWQLK